MRTGLFGYGFIAFAASRTLPTGDDNDGEPSPPITRGEGYDTTIVVRYASVVLLFLHIARARLLIVIIARFSSVI